MKGTSQHVFDPREVMAYLDGELEPQQATALAAHLEHCIECQGVAAALRHASERLLDFQIEPCPANLEEPITAALNSTERNRSATLKFAVPKRRRIRRGLAWAVCSVVVVLLIAIPLVHQLRQAAELAAEHDTGLAVDQERLELYAKLQPVPPVSTHATRRVPTKGILGGVPGGTAGTGAPADSNGLLHGLGDHGENSFSIEGQPATDQESKLFSNRQPGVEAPELRGPMIVQTASITILASNYDQVSGAIESIARQHGGYIQDMNADTRTGMARSVSATLRVPDNQLQAALADLRKLGHVEQETRNNQEITDQYVDLTARLKSARATEQRILQLLATRTGKLSDVLEAEQELARIRGEIESMDGQRVTMEHQVHYATVQLQLNEEYREQLNSKAATTGTLLRNSIVDGLRNFAGSAIWLLTVAFSLGPSALFWLAILGTPAWFAWRRYRRSRAST